MKRLITLLLALSMALCACAFPGSHEGQTAFYYPVAASSYTMEEAYIQPEYRQITDTELAQLLRVYLLGPQDNQSFSSPFPAGTGLVSVSMEDGLLDVTLSTGFSACTGLELTIACACLTMTCLELTQAETVRIRADGAQLDGTPWVQMQRSDLLLTDPGKDVTQSK